MRGRWAAAGAGATGVWWEPSRWRRRPGVGRGSTLGRDAQEPRPSAARQDTCDEPLSRKPKRPNRGSQCYGTARPRRHWAAEPAPAGAGSGPASLPQAAAPLPVGVPVGHRRFGWGVTARRGRRLPPSLLLWSSHPSDGHQEGRPSPSPGPGAQSATATQALVTGLSLLPSGPPCAKRGTPSMPPARPGASPCPQRLQLGSARRTPVPLPLVGAGHMAPPRGVWGMWSRQDHHFQRLGGEQGPSACPRGRTSVCPPMCFRRQRAHPVTRACRLTARRPPRPTGPCPRHAPQQPVPGPRVSTGLRGGDAWPELGPLTAQEPLA